jgi:hypothetical protein
MAISGINTQSPPLEQKKTPYNIDDIKKEHNKNIIASQLEVSLRDGTQVMSLLFRTALEEINKSLAPSLAEDETGLTENTIKKAYESDIDFSPQATAERIFTGATAFFNAYKAQNSELSDNEALSKFMGVIRSGIDTGFGEARDILESLSVLESDIASNIDATYDYVQTGLNDFSKKIITTIEKKRHL